MYGCIPVIMQDEVSQPFDDILPYDKFSVRVAEKDLERLPEMLRKIPTSCDGVGPDDLCLPRMRQQLACAVRSFLWSSVFGSAYGEGGEDDAFALTMLSLQHRVATYVKHEAGTGPLFTHHHAPPTCDVPRLQLSPLFS